MPAPCMKALVNVLAESVAGAMGVMNFSSESRFSCESRMRSGPELVAIAAARSEVIVAGSFWT